MIDRQGPDDRVLGQVRVLIFVDQDVAIALVEPGPRISGFSRRSVATCSSRSSKSTALALEQPPLIGGINPARCRRAPRPRLILVGGDQVVLGPTDRVGHGVGRGVGELDILVDERLAKHLAGVVHVVDRIVLAKADRARVPPQEPRAEAVEGSHPDAGRGGQPGEAGLHLVGRLVGERERENLARMDADREEVGDPVRYDTGLAAPGPARMSSGPSTCVTAASCAVVSDCTSSA
jgi:hypothetical protein